MSRQITWKVHFYKLSFSHVADWESAFQHVPQCVYSADKADSPIQNKNQALIWAPVAFNGGYE